MKYIILSIMSILLTSCKNGYEKNIDIMSGKVKSYINDMAFKDNLKVEFHSFTPIGYDTIDENIIDKIKAAKYIETAEYFLKKQKEQLSIIKKESQEATLYNNIGMKDLRDMSINNAQEANKKLQEYGDSLSYYTDMAKKLDTLIDNRKNPNTIFEFKVFLKTSFVKQNGENAFNILDTLYYVFDKDLNFIPKYFTE
nr:MAG TPA: hypothetical protein [Caudoviricetes sp.]